MFVKNIYTLNIKINANKLRLWLTILFLCCCVILSAQTYRIGDVYTAPDGSRGIVYYIHPDGSGGWVVALTDASDGCTWGDTTDVPELTNQNPTYKQNLLYDTSGYVNTQTLRSYQNNNATYAAGKVDFAHGWVLPSPAQLRMLYGQLPFIDTAITNAGGTTLANGVYWSSAECSGSKAWRANFHIEFYQTSKSTSCRVRAVRSFTNTSIAYDTALTYQWNTGSTQPYIDVNPSQTTTYQVTATTDFGCSNTAEQTVLVGSGSAQTIYDTVCRGAGYEANGFTLTADETQTAGTLTRTRTMTTSGCSSNLTLQLKVNEPVTSTFSATATGNYTWNGVTYYESGDYTQHFNSADGCDSVVTLRLTITEPLQFSIAATDDTICEGDEVTLQVVTAGSSSNFQVPPIAVGDILCTDGTTVKPADYANSGKTAMGVVFYVDNTGAHGWAVHLHYQHIGIEWTTPMSAFMDIPTLTNYSTSRTAINDFDGYNNTIKIRNAGNAATYPAAYAVDFGNGWYIPAAGQLRQLFNEIVEVRASLQIVGGDVLSLDSSHWSSTEAGSNNVWDVRDRGTVYRNSKHSMIRLRSVRSF